MIRKIAITFLVLFALRAGGQTLGSDGGIKTTWYFSGTAQNCSTTTTTNCISSYTETFTPPQSQAVTVITIPTALCAAPATSCIQSGTGASTSPYLSVWRPGGKLYCGQWAITLTANWLDGNGNPQALSAQGTMNEPCPFTGSAPTGLVASPIP